MKAYEYECIHMVCLSSILLADEQPVYAIVKLSQVVEMLAEAIKELEKKRRNER